MKDIGYMKFAEIEAYLRQLVAAHPELAALSSAGKSYEGRDLWVLTVTNERTGAAAAKPAMYIEANMHAGEVTGTAVCLYTAVYLLEQYGQDEGITDLLDTRAFYILPRVSPDGAELYLTSPQSTRSAVRRYPVDVPRTGLCAEDIDGDGLILQMRVPDPQGEWRVSDRDPRCMVKRRPGEEGGKYYRLLPEGFVRRADGTTVERADVRDVRVAPPQCGLDFNRNYPANWAPEAKQRGAGPYPLSEPETRAVADFIINHPNIVAAMSYHTSGGVILRPFSTKNDSAFSEADLELYKRMAEIGRATTGYEMIPVYGVHGLNGEKPSHGDFKDWTYEHRGVIVFTTELWNLRERAGIKTDWSAEGGEDDLLKVFAWNDRELAGRGWVDWHAYSHPQLGPVEIGGWRSKEMLQNPPLELLPEECHKNMMFTLKVAALLPHLTLSELSTQPVGPGVHRIEGVVANSGYLPTHGCQQALAINTARTVSATLRPGPGTTVIGEQTIDLGHLAGHATRRFAFTVATTGGAAPLADLTIGAPRCGTIEVGIADHK
jgi:murein tripeptide amidase MpaA